MALRICPLRFPACPKVFPKYYVEKTKCYVEMSEYYVRFPMCYVDAPAYGAEKRKSPAAGRPKDVRRRTFRSVSS